MRLAMNPVVTGAMVTAGVAVASLGSLRADTRAEFLPDTSSLAVPTIELSGLIGYRQVTDMHLVNLVSMHSARLVTFDAKLVKALTPGDQERVRVLG